MITPKPFLRRKVITLLLFALGIGWIFVTDYLGIIFIEDHFTFLDFNRLRGVIFVTVASTGLYTLLFYRDKKIYQNQQFAESILKTVDIGLAAVNEEGEFVLFNKAFENLVGYNKDELEGLSFIRVVPGNQKTRALQHFNNLLEGKDPNAKEWIIDDFNDNKKIVISKPTLLTGDKGKKHVIVALTDITEQKQLQTELEQALEEKDVLLSEIHHRVKNNLAIISGLLTLEAMNWDEDTTVYQVLTQSKLRVHSMAKIHEKLYDSGSFTDIELGNYITELTETIFQNMNVCDKNIALNVECDEVTLNINQALPAALIINELVTNAFKYAFDENHRGALEVIFRNDEGTITLVVSDNGPGLPDYFKTMTEKSLGHRLIHQLVKQLDGDITVESREGGGTRYVITFEKMDKSGSSSNLAMKNYKH